MSLSPRTRNTNNASTFYVFAINLAFYISLWLLNPSNKIIALAFVFLYFAYFYRFKNLKLSLLLTYLSSTVIFTGKRYLIQLAPPGVFPTELYPSGFLTAQTISPLHILSFLMLLVLIRHLVQNPQHRLKLNLIDLLLISYYLLSFISNGFASRRPEISLISSVLSLHIPILYFYIRVFRFKQLPTLLVWLFASLVIFESAISLQQFISASPLGKNLESMVNIAQFGLAPDESAFRFRPLGTFGHANSLAAWLSFVGLFIFSALFYSSSSTLFLTLLLSVIVLVLSLSRSAWLGFGISFILILFYFEKIKHIQAPKLIRQNLPRLALLSLPLVLFFVLPRAEKTLYSFGELGGGGHLRSMQIKDSLSLILSHPFFGVGANMDILEGLLLGNSSIFGVLPLSVHNWYLFRAVVGGLPSLFIFLIFIIKIVRLSLVRLKTQSPGNLNLYLTVGLLGGTLSSFIIGILQPNINEPLLVLSAVLLQQINNKS